MPIQVPTSVADLMEEVRETLSHTRGVTDAELLRALSFGHRKIVRALRAVRAEHYVAKKADFSLPGGISEIDLSSLDPPILRPLKLKLDGDRRSVLFRPRGIQSPEFEGMEHARSGMFSTVLYDMLRGFFPQPYTEITSVGDDNGSDAIGLEDVSTFEVGGLIQVTGGGPPQTYGADELPNDYLGIVIALAGSIATVSPDFSETVTAGVSMARRIRTAVLQLANPPAETLTGVLWYQYDPSQLTAAMLLDPGISMYRDPIVYYALSQLLQATNETDADRWFQKAEEMKAEVFQDADPISLQGSEAMTSGLYGTDE